MSGKFMSVKRYIIPTITMVIIASQLMGCAAAGSSELVQMLQNGDQIEIEVASPAFAEEEQGTESQILWEQLASLETNEVLRKAWDNNLKITVTETGKNGILYVDAAGQNENNNTLRVAMHNRAFQKMFESEEGVASLAEGALNNYVDLDAEDEYKAALMAVNGYFNLIPDMEVNYANADSTLQRNEFMAMVFRADTEVQELQSDGSLTNAVGQSDYNIYAQGVVADSYLDLASKSLNNMTYNGSITRAEVVYMLVNRYFESELGAVDIKTADVKFSDAKDGGNIAEQQKFIENGVAKDYWKSYELTYALTNPDGGLPTDLYKALVVAKQVGILEGTETRWDEAVTRAEAIEFIINALKNDDSIATFNYTQGEISGYEVTDKAETEQDSSVNSTSDNIEYEDGEYQGNNPNDVANKPDTNKSAFDEAMEVKDPNADSGLTVGPDGYAIDGVGLDLDKDGKISNFEAEFWQGIQDRTPTYPTTNNVPSGSTTTPDGGSTIPGPTGQQGNLVEGGGKLESEGTGVGSDEPWGSGDYSGLEGGTVY